MSVYIYLYNGLTFDEERDDWGDEGPTFGPYNAIQITHGCHIKMYDQDDIAADLSMNEYGVYYDGKMYGDQEIFSEPMDSRALVLYDSSKAGWFTLSESTNS